MDGNAVMELLKTSLQTHVGATRVVTRELADFAERKDADIVKGIYSLAPLYVDGLDSVRDLTDLVGRMRILLVAQIRLAESAARLAVEQAEWAMWEEIKAFCKAPGAGLCSLTPVRLELSGQRFHPHGELAVELDYQELD